MRTADLLTALEGEGELFARAVEFAGADAEVPSCPGWRVRDLTLHQGQVHRWATRYVAESLTERQGFDEVKVADEEVADWLREGHARLVTALREAPEDLECFTFLPGSPSPLHFWTRRQTHETTVHRVDAELATGGALSPVAPRVAADGIDELLTGFATRARTRFRTETPRTLRLRATDVPEAPWALRFSDAPLQVTREDEGADGPGPGPLDGGDCEVSGPAELLYLALWNRRSFDGLTVEGDASLAELWQATARV
ncbi:maleylpyruvate isomerase family mycothiol-dependent enzyme [Streptomyces daliensis]|uniref:Maleylpyruvate isomerase family mycothiol-dependent enzyme n=1 Tax=Streptomyces daliensis TaxID=299421 RepID=A0A8T4ITP6_9ACTN|nr:maleylpyruvate isomerase family mycothiol-dependent enzyme [Streptomyces daliensis]